MDRSDELQWLDNHRMGRLGRRKVQSATMLYLTFLSWNGSADPEGSVAVAVQLGAVRTGSRNH